MTKLIDGIIVGGLETEHIDNLDTCIKDINPLVTIMKAAVDDFEDGGFYKIA